MHVVVTGGAGFIGSNVSAAYLRGGHRLTILDALCRPGTERNLDWLESLAPTGRLRFVRGDVRDPELVQTLVGAAGVDLVFHFAAQTAVTTSVTAPRGDLEVNVLGTHNVLEALRTTQAAEPPVLFYTSTNKVYGALEHRSVVEGPTRYCFADSGLATHGIAEDEPLDFHSPYGCSKGAADQYVHDYARIYGLRTVVFRMSCIYGARQFGTEDQGWVAHFMLKAAAGAPLTIYGNGKQVRDLLYIDDLVRAFELAHRHIDMTAGNVYNIGGGPPNNVSVWTELRPHLEQLAGHRMRARFGAWRPGDQPIFTTDTRKAARDFTWKPKVNVDEGLERLWRWAESLTCESAARALPATRARVVLAGSAE